MIDPIDIKYLCGGVSGSESAEPSSQLVYSALIRTYSHVRSHPHATASKAPSPRSTAISISAPRHCRFSSEIAMSLDYAAECAELRRGLKTVSKRCALRVLRGDKSLDFQTVSISTHIRDSTINDPAAIATFTPGIASDARA